MIRCPELLGVAETDGIITITCNRSSALPFQSVVNVTSEDGTALGKLVLFLYSVIESLMVAIKTKILMAITKKVSKLLWPMNLCSLM